MFIFQEMVRDPAFALSFLAILVMIYCLWLVLSLKSEVAGGMVGKQWAMLMWLVVLFCIGYLTTPFFRNLPPETLRLITSLIFLFGAVYVVITVKLIYRIIKVLSE